MFPNNRLRDISVTFLIGAILIFMPPYVKIFDQQSFLFGIPVLHIYLFVLWFVGIILTGVVSHIIVRHGRQARESNDPAPPDEAGGA